MHKWLAKQLAYSYQSGAQYSRVRERFSQFAVHQVVVRSRRSCSARRRPSEIHVETRRSGPPAARLVPMSRVPLASKTPLARARCAPRAPATRRPTIYSTPDAEPLESAAQSASMFMFAFTFMFMFVLFTPAPRLLSPLFTPPFCACAPRRLIALQCARSVFTVWRGPRRFSFSGKVTATSSSRARSHTCNRRSMPLHTPRAEQVRRTASINVTLLYGFLRGPLERQVSMKTGQRLENRARSQVK